MSNVAPGIPRTALPHEVLRAVLDALDRGLRVVLASVLARHGSAPSTPGQKLALFEDGAAIGTIGGGAVERVVLTSMIKALDTPLAVPRVETFRLGASLGMCCGGSVDILIEPIIPPVHALLIGAGHVGAFVAPLLASLGFRVTLCDAREEAVDPARMASVVGAEANPATVGGVRLLLAEHDDPEVSRLIGVPSEAIALVMTHDHMIDQEAIEWAIERGFGFVGGVGSRAKAARTRARLEAKGVGSDDVARVRMPIGVDIGARSPAEIGVSIAAELVAWRAGRQRARWQASAGPEGSVATAPADRSFDGSEAFFPGAPGVEVDA